MSVVDLLSTALLGLGGLVMLAAAIGVVRFPDFYSRLHAAGKGDTLGQGLMLCGLALPFAWLLVRWVFGADDVESVGDAFVLLLKLGLIVLFVFVLNPTATHALARGAWVSGQKPWTRLHGDAPTVEPPAPPPEADPTVEIEGE